MNPVPPDTALRRRFRLALALSLPPFVLLVFMVCRYNVDVPHWDQWEFVPILDKWYAGTLSWHNFWTQHNEHRLIFPRLLMLALALPTGWNIYFEYGASIILASGLLALFARWVWAHNGQLRPSAMWILPAIAALLFSPSQWQNWYLGWQLQIFMNLLAVATGLLILDTPQINWLRLAGAAGCGIVATYSFANGFLFWFIVLPVLATRAAITRGPRRLPLTVWTLVSVLTLTSFFWGFHTAGKSIEPVQLVRSLHILFVYVLKYLGGAIVYVRHTGPVDTALHQYGALLWGSIGIATAGGLLAKTWIHHRDKITDLMPMAMIALYAILSALLAGAGRLGNESTAQALSSRYITIANLFWVALLCMGIRIMGHNKAAKQTLARRLGMAAGLLVLLGFVAMGYGYGWLAWSERYDYLMEARQALESGVHPDLYTRLYPKPEVVAQRRIILQKHRLSVFRESAETRRDPNP